MINITSSNETKTLISDLEKRGGGKKSFAQTYSLWIIFGLFVLLLLILHRFILLTGDDYMHSCVVQGTASSFWDWHVHHYLRGNGRALVHFFLTLAFALPNAELQRICNPFVIAFVLLLGAKICNTTRAQFQKSFLVLCLIFLGLFGFFMSMGIYSFTPAFNYVHPMLFTFGMVLLTRRAYEDKPYGKGFCIAYWVTSFLAGASVEQTGIMTIGYIVLIAFFAFVQQRKKPRKAVCIALALTILGYLTVMLAPGNFVRMGESTKPFLENFISATTMLLNTKSFAFFNLTLILCFVYWLLRIRPDNKLLFLFHICLCIGLIVGDLVNLFLLFNPFDFSFESGGLFALIWRGYDLLFIFCCVYVPIRIALSEKDWSYAEHMCIALGSVFILLFASVSPYRPLIPTVLTFMVFMTKTILTATDNIKMCRAAFTVMAVMAAVAFCVNLRGYYLNYIADKENIEIIAQYLSDDSRAQELHLHPYADRETSGYSICVPGAVLTQENPDHVMYVPEFKQFYGLPQKTTLIFDLQ